MLKGFYNYYHTMIKRNQNKIRGRNKYDKLIVPYQFRNVITIQFNNNMLNILQKFLIFIKSTYSRNTLIIIEDQSNPAKNGKKSFQNAYFQPF